MNGFRNTGSRFSCCTLIASLGLAHGVMAQGTSTGQTQEEDVVALERLIVTGSNIPTAADAVAVPVTILGRAELEATGLDTNLLEVLQKRMPIFAGNGNLGVTNSNVGGNSTIGGSNIAVRNLDTLVLLDGRRLPTNGANGRGGRSFVDVNQIPLAAVQTIEVLTDGASAIYGSDAVGGVVNVKLRSDYEGAEVGGRYGFSTRDGDYKEKSGYVVMGAKNDRLSITVSGSTSDITPLFQANRPFSTPIVGRTATISGAVSQASTNFPQAFLRTDLGSPSQAVPTGPNAIHADLQSLIAAGVYQAGTFQSIANTFDLSPLVTLTLESQKKAGTAVMSVEIIPDVLELELQGMYSRSDSFSQLAAQPVTATVPVNSPYNPTTSSIFAAFRMVPKPREFHNTGELKRGVAVLHGKFLEKFSWEVGYNHNENTLYNEVHNVLYAPNLQLALAGGYDASGNPQVGGRYSRVFRDFGAPPGLTNLAGYQGAITAQNSILQPALDIFARPDAHNPASLENIFGFSSATFESNLKQFDVTLRGNDLFQLPGGGVGAAVGFAQITEELAGIPDPNSYSSGPTAGRWSGATFFNPFARDRDIKGAYAEVKFPIAGEGYFQAPGLHALDLTAAYRWEDYSDAGKSDVPKYGIRWQPFSPELTLRATYSEAFSAPALYSLFGPTTQGFTATSVVPNVFGVNGQARSRTGSNPNLRPSTAETWSTGVVYSPRFLRGLTVTANYINVDQVDLVGSAGTTEILRSVEALGPASPYINQVHIGNWAVNPDPEFGTSQAITAAGQLGNMLRTGTSANTIFIYDALINIAGLKVKALDVSVDYEFPATDFGKFTFGTTGTFFIDYKFQALPTQPYYEYAGHITNGGTGAQGSVPGMRWYSTVDWRKGAWGAMIANTYIDDVTDIGPGGITFASSTTLVRRPVESFSPWDVAASYTFGQMTGRGFKGNFLSGARLTVGVNNVFDEMPPLSPQAFNESNVDVSTYSPIGRLFYVDLRVKF
jgi:iron complex outermembrane recepter protein